MENIRIDKDNNYATITINPNVYSLDVVRSAAYVFLDKAYIIIDETPDNKIVIYLKPKNESSNDLSMEFYNELLNYAHYSSMVKDNYEIIKMIIQRALFSSDPSMVKDIEDSEIENLLKELEEEGDEDIKEVIKEIRDDDKNNKRGDKTNIE